MQLLQIIRNNGGYRFEEVNDFPFMSDSSLAIGLLFDGRL